MTDDEVLQALADAWRLFPAVDHNAVELRGEKDAKEEWVRLMGEIPRVLREHGIRPEDMADNDGN